MVEYEINRNTLAIIPIDKNKCEVYEINKHFFVETSARKVIEHSCRYFGSSYLGRIEGSKSLIKSTYKVPIIIDDLLDIIFFPTSSIRDNNCIWISYNNVVDYCEKDDNCFITFKEDNKIEFPHSYYIIDNQMSRSMKLHCSLLNRINDKKKIS